MRFLSSPFTEGRLEWGKGERSEERVRERSEGRNLGAGWVFPSLLSWAATLLPPQPPSADDRETHRPQRWRLGATRAEYKLFQQPVVHNRPRRRFCLRILRDVDRRVVGVDDDVVVDAVEPRALHRHRAVTAGGGFLEVFAGLTQAVVGVAEAPDVSRVFRDDAGAAGHGAPCHARGRVLVASDDRVAHAVAPRATVELLEEL